MRGPSPAAGLAEPIFVRRRNPFRHGKLFLRVPRATHPTGDDGPCEMLVRGEHHPVSFQSRRRYEVGDGALLLTHDHGDEGLILWTLGPLVCEPMPVPKKLMDYLAQVKTGAVGDAM